MVTAEYFLFCESKAQGDAGQLSLQNIFDKVYASDFPASQRPFMIVTRLTPQSKALLNKDLKINIKASLNGEEVNSLEAVIQNVTIEMGNGAGLGFDVSQFVFPEAGDYTFTLFINDKEAASKILQVRSTAELTEN